MPEVHLRHGVTALAPSLADYGHPEDAGTDTSFGSFEIGAVMGRNGYRMVPPSPPEGRPARPLDEVRVYIGDTASFVGVLNLKDLRERSEYYRGIIQRAYASGDGGQTAVKEIIKHQAELMKAGPTRSARKLLEANRAEVLAARHPPVSAAPPRAVTFELDQAGEISAYYHGILTTPEAVILVVDHSRSDIVRYLPPSRSDDAGQPAAMVVRVHAEHDEPDGVFLVYYGLTFRDGPREYIVLVRDREVEDHDGEERDR